MPVIGEPPGYVSPAIYIDHRTNQAQTVSLWESKEAMEATAQGSAYLARVAGLLRSCLVNREYAQWEVRAHGTLSSHLKGGRRGETRRRDCPPRCSHLPPMQTWAIV